MLSRRELLATTGLSVAAAACKSPPRATATAAPSSDVWSEVRSQFQLSPHYLHFSQFFLVSHPRPVREAIER